MIRRKLYPAPKELTIEKKYLHDFRRFRVTVLVGAGVLMHIIKAWIGHGLDEMVARYTHGRPAYHQQHLVNVPSVLEPFLLSHIEVLEAVA